MKNYLNQNKSIALIGFMGVGKTTLGKTLAKNLDYKPIDIDKEIVRKFNMPITDIFAQYGEDTFRETEKTMTIHWAKEKQNVLSLGGGAFLQNEIKQACLNHCIVIYLEMSWEYWKKRLGQLIDTRPLLQGKDINDIRNLFEQRIKQYQDFHLKVDIDGLSIEEGTKKLTKILKDKA